MQTPLVLIDPEMTVVPPLTSVDFRTQVIAVRASRVVDSPYQ